MTTCTDPEGIMLSEISQTEKDKYYIIPFNGNVNLKKKNQIHRQKINCWLPESGVGGWQTG